MVPEAHPGLGRGMEGEAMSEHCPTCTCERRAPVQADRASDDRRRKPRGTVSWEEHLKAWGVYSRMFGTRQDAERIAKRGGFGYREISNLLGYEPLTWRPA